MNNSQQPENVETIPRSMQASMSDPRVYQTSVSISQNLSPAEKLCTEMIDLRTPTKEQNRNNNEYTKIASSSIPKHESSYIANNNTPKDVILHMDGGVDLCPPKNPSYLITRNVQPPMVVLDTSSPVLNHTQPANPLQTLPIPTSQNLPVASNSLNLNVSSTTHFSPNAVQNTIAGHRPTSSSFHSFQYTQQFNSSPLIHRNSQYAVTEQQVHYNQVPPHHVTPMEGFEKHLNQSQASSEREHLQNQSNLQRHEVNSYHQLHDVSAHQQGFNERANETSTILHSGPQRHTNYSPTFAQNQEFSNYISPSSYAPSTQPYLNSTDWRSQNLNVIQPGCSISKLHQKPDNSGENFFLPGERHATAAACNPESLSPSPECTQSTQPNLSQDGGQDTETQCQQFPRKLFLDQEKQNGLSNGQHMTGASSNLLHPQRSAFFRPDAMRSVDQTFLKDGLSRIKPYLFPKSNNCAREESYSSRFPSIQGEDTTNCVNPVENVPHDRKGLTPAAQYILGGNRNSDALTEDIEIGVPRKGRTYETTIAEEKLPSILPKLDSDEILNEDSITDDADVPLSGVAGLKKETKADISPDGTAPPSPKPKRYTHKSVFSEDDDLPPIRDVDSKSDIKASTSKSNKRKTRKASQPLSKQPSKERKQVAVGNEKPAKKPVFKNHVGGNKLLRPRRKDNNRTTEPEEKQKSRTMRTSDKNHTDVRRSTRVKRKPAHVTEQGKNECENGDSDSDDFEEMILTEKSQVRKSPRKRKAPTAKERVSGKAKASKSMTEVAGPSEDTRETEAEESCPSQDATNDAIILKVGAIPRRKRKKQTSLYPDSARRKVSTDELTTIRLAFVKFYPPPPSNMQAQGRYEQMYGGEMPPEMIRGLWLKELKPWSDRWWQFYTDFNNVARAKKLEKPPDKNPTITEAEAKKWAKEFHEQYGNARILAKDLSTEENNTR